MATARFTLVTLLALGLVVSGAQTAQAVDAVSLTASAATVTAGSKVVLKASMPVSQAGTSSQEIVQDIDPVKIKLTSIADISYPTGWTLSYKFVGVSTYSSTTPTTATDTSTSWDKVISVKATGPVSSLAPSNGLQVTEGSATGTPVLTAPAMASATANGSGDGMYAFFDATRTRVFNLYHHSTVGPVPNNLDCHVVATGAVCQGFPFAGPGPTGHFAVGKVINNKIWYTTTDAATGIACVDISQVVAASGGPFSCGTYPVSSQMLSATTFTESPSALEHETQFWATSRSSGNAYCFDTLTKTTCGTINTGLGAPTNSENFAREVGVVQWETRLYTVSNGVVSCADTRTTAKCPGFSSNVDTGTANVFSATQADVLRSGGRLFLLPNEAGEPVAVCVITSSNATMPCWDESGNSVTAPISLSGSIKDVSYMESFGVVSRVGTRIIWGSGNYRDGLDASTVNCWDAALNSGAGGSCAFASTGLDYRYKNYTAVPDPLVKDCIWVVGHYINPIIQTVNLRTGNTGCSNLSPDKTVTFSGNTVVQRMGCESTGESPIRSWGKFTLTTPATGYTSAKLTVVSSDGVDVPGWSEVSISGYEVDLSTLSVIATGNKPLFRVTFAGLSGTVTSASAKVTAVGDAPSLCVSPTAIYACPGSLALGPLTASNLQSTITANGSSTISGSTVSLAASTADIEIAISESQCGATLSGRAGDASLGSGGSGVAGVMVALLNSSGIAITSGGNIVTTTTASDGSFSFGYLTPGSYKVSFSEPANKTVASSTVTAAGAGTVTVANSATSVTSNTVTLAVGTNGVVNALYSIPASASTDTSTGAWDTNQTISPLSNDVASSGATLTASSLKLCASNETAPSCTLTSLTVPGEGTYTVNANGTVTFDPLPTFNGTATAVNYQVSDSASNVVSSSFQASVAAPVPSSATADATTGVKGATQTVAPQNNDTSGSGITFTNSSVKLCAVGVLPPNCSATTLTNSAGTYTVNASTGVITFTPDASFTGNAPAMTYQVSDSSGQTVSSTYTATVTGVPATDNETTSGAWNQSQTISLINGDTAGYGTTLTASSVKLCGPSDTAPNCTQTSLTVSGVGTYTVDSSGNVTFTPDASFTGTAPVVTYSVTDSLNQKATGTYTATVASPAAPTANPEQKAVLPGGTATFTATVSGSTPLASGSQLKTGASGGPTFVCPVTGATSCSATSVVVPGEGTWSMDQTTGVATFAALNSAVAGTLTPVSYRVTDVTGQTATAVLTSVIPPAPTAAADSSRGAVGSTQFVAVLGNDAPGSAAADLTPGSVKLCGVSETAPNCTLTSKTVSGEGTYTVLSNGVVKFVPVAGYHGTATAQSYQVADNLGQVVSSTLQVVVVPPPFPIANVDTGSAAYGQSVTLKPLLNDAAGVVPSGETAPAPNIVSSSLKLCAVGQSAPNCSASTVTTDDGTYVLNTSTGEVGFTPVAGFSGTVTSPVTYQVSNDWSGLSGPGTATSLLMPTIAPPGSPLALNDTAQTAPMTPVTVDPLTNDVAGTGTLTSSTVRLCSFDEIAPDCTQTSVTVREGVFSVNTTTGEVTFTPNTNFDENHPAQITYAVQDSLNLWTNATITITDPPPASVVNQITNLARTGASTFGGPLPLTAFVALVGGVSVVFFAHKSRLKPGTAFMKLEFSDSYRKLQSSLQKSSVTASAEQGILSEGTEKIYRYVDGRPD